MISYVFISISIHALREEGDHGVSSASPMNFLFLSTPSARRATFDFVFNFGWQSISIHALREEGDCPDLSRPTCQTDFYPRPPRGGRRHSRKIQKIQPKFLSTPSARRATERGGVSKMDVRIFLSTPSARRATLALPCFFFVVGISIHALREEGDQETAPIDIQQEIISIHALREEGDLHRLLKISLIVLFLSTPSARRATFLLPSFFHNIVISIHALREEGDRLIVLVLRAVTLFLSTPSARRATDFQNCYQVVIDISIHALREEGDCKAGRNA